MPVMLHQSRPVKKYLRLCAATKQALKRTTTTHDVRDVHIEYSENV